MEDDKFYEAIAEGVRRAVWDIATNATDAPCQDFYEYIQKGVKEAHEALKD